MTSSLSLLLLLHNHGNGSQGSPLLPTSQSSREERGEGLFRIVPFPSCFSSAMTLTEWSLKSLLAIFLAMRLEEIRICKESSGGSFSLLKPFAFVPTQSCRWRQCLAGQNLACLPLVSWNGRCTFRDSQSLNGDVIFFPLKTNSLKLGAKSFFPLGKVISFSMYHVKKHKTLVGLKRDRERK